MFACGVSPRSIAVAESGPDTLPRLFLGTGAPDNGASEGGFDDAHSYVIALTLEGKVAWSREMGGKFSSTSVCLDELDGLRERLAEVAHLAPPVVAVIGEVVGLRARLAWFDEAALTDAARAEAEPLEAQVREMLLRLR